MTTDQSRPNSKIAIIAGNGQLPIEAGRALLARGEEVFMIGIATEVDARIERFDHAVLQWEQLGKLFRLLRDKNIGQVLLAGGVIGRPALDIRKMDWGAIRTLPEILSVMLAGDNKVLSGVIEIFRRRGVAMASVPELLPELMVGAGPLAAKKVSKADHQRLTHGAEVVRTLGAHDIGQAVVVVGSRVVAVEGAEGTDMMLERIGQLRRAGRLPARRCGVLVKFAKPEQDIRADLPTIGPGTISKVHEAGLLGIGVEAGRTIVIQRAETVSRANGFGLFVHGLDGGA